MERSPSKQESSLPSFSPALLAELKRLELRTKRSVDSDLLGRYRSAFRGTGLTFSDVREYQPGDDVRHIHWKVTARTKMPFVKTFEEDRQLQIVLAIDVSRSMLFGAPRSKHARASEFAALIATLCHRSQDKLSLCLFAGDVIEYLPPRSGRSQVQRVLYALLQERALPQETSVSAALEHLLSHQKRNSVVFLCSDFLSSPFNEELRALSFRHDVICVFLEDELDSQLPRVGLVHFTDAETKERVCIDTSSRAFREQLKTSASERKRALQELCSTSKTDLICIQQSPLAPLIQLMQRRTTRMR